MGDRRAPNGQDVDPSDAGSSESGAIVRVVNAGSVPSNEGRALNEETRRVEVIPEMFRRSSVVMRSPPKLNSGHISADPVPQVESEQNRGAPRSLAVSPPAQASDVIEAPSGLGDASESVCGDWPNYQSMLTAFEAEIDKMAILVSKAPTTARVIKEQAQVLKRRFFKIKTSMPLAPEAAEGCSCKDRHMVDAATQANLGNEKLASFRSLLQGATTDDLRAQLITKDWPTDAFTHSSTAALDAAIGDSNVRVVILPRGGSGENVRKMCAQTAGLQMVLESDELKGGSCAILRGHLNVEIDGVHLDRSEHLPSVTIVGRPEEEPSSKDLSTLRILRTALTHLDGVSSFSIITGCGVGRTRKAVELLLAGSDRTVKVVDAAVPSAKRSAVPAPAPSSVVTIRGEGLSFADILKTVKANVDVDKHDLKIASIRKRQDQALSIRIKGGGEKAALFLKEVNKSEELNAEVHRRMDTLEVRDLEHESSSEDISKAFTEMIPGSTPADFAVTSVRPSYAGTARATVRAPSEWTGQILEKRRIKIGWVLCRIVRRTRPTHCFKCWAEDHLSSTCKGTDRTKNCYRCGGSDHLKARCTADKWCPVCKTAEHSFDDGVCKKKYKTKHGH